MGAKDPALTGIRAAIQRSLLAGTLAAAVAGLALSTQPAVEAIGRGRDALRAAAEPTARGEAGGMGLRLLLVIAAAVALRAAVHVRREPTLFAAKALIAIAGPLGLWLLTGGLHEPGADEQPTWALRMLGACLASLIAAGPLVAVAGGALHRWEARARPTPSAIVRQP